MRPQPDKNVISWLDIQGGKDVWISSVTQAEILAGLALMPEGKRKQGLMAAAAAMFEEDFTNQCKPFDGESAKHYADIVSKRIQQGKPISVEDAQIASIARTHNLTLATRNVKDFVNIDGLVVINPWQVSLA